jgi:hypothetical protein
MSYADPNDALQNITDNLSTILGYLVWRVNESKFEGHRRSTVQASDKQQQNEWTLAPDMDADEDIGEGLSSPYATRLSVALESIPSRTLSCGACKEEFQPHQLVRCPCEDACCTQCLTLLCMRATKDESRFPPRCCQQNFARSMIEDTLSASTPFRTLCTYILVLYSSLG